MAPLLDLFFFFRNTENSILFFPLPLTECTVWFLCIGLGLGLNHRLAALSSLSCEVGIE